MRGSTVILYYTCMCSQCISLTLSQAKDLKEHRIGICQDGPVHGRHYFSGARDERAT